MASSVEGIQVVGGQIVYSKLTSILPEKEYAVAKAVVWLEMLKEGKRPLRWCAPTEEGTEVAFSHMRSESDVKKELEQLELYLDSINDQFTMDIELAIR